MSYSSVDVRAGRTSKTSGPGGDNLDEASPLLFTGHFSDLHGSLNVASISLYVSVTDEVNRDRADRK